MEKRGSTSIRQAKGSHATASPEELGRKTIRRFLFYVGLVIGVSYAMLTYGLITQTRNLMVTIYATAATEAAEEFVTRNLTAEKLGQPVSSDTYQAFHQQMRESLSTSGLSQAKIWSPEGKIVYASDDSVVGQVFPIEKELRQALQGQSVTEVPPFELAAILSSEGIKNIKRYIPVSAEGTGEVIGVLEADLTFDGVAAAVKRSWMIQTLGMSALLLVVMGVVFTASRILVRQNVSLKYLSHRLRILADTDGLTSLPNHRRFHERFDEEMNRAIRYQRPLSLVMGDLDKFKTINDEHGHQLGDQALAKVGLILAQHTRRIDFAARYGGDEFALILPETEAVEAIHLAERLRGTIAKEIITASDGTEIPLSVSIGVADFPSCSKDKDSLIGSADAALRGAKKAGRARVLYYREVNTTKRSKKGAEQEIQGICKHLQDASTTSFVALAAAVDTKDQYDDTHALGAVEMVDNIASQLGLNAFLLETLRLAVKVHDIGKLVVPIDVLHKEGPLTGEEVETIRRHPEVGKRILESSAQMHHLLPALLYHHERFDGKGYPFGLKGDEIPLTARVLHVIDAYQAMTSKRPYKRALSPEEAAQELKRCAGTQFDPELVEKLIRALRARTAKRASADAEPSQS